jgi:hypothetical protein
MRMRYCDLCGSQIPEREPTVRITISTEEVLLLPEVQSISLPRETWRYDISFGTWILETRFPIDSTSWSPPSVTRTFPANTSTVLVLEICKECREKLGPFLTNLKEAMEGIVRK